MREVVQDKEALDIKPGMDAKIGTAHKETGPTLRAVIIGFFAIIPAVYWGVYGDVVSQTDLTSTSLMMPPIMVLVALLLVNKLLKRWIPNKRLRQNELVTIYIMLLVSVVLSGMGMLQFLCTTIGALPHYKTTEPDLAKLWPYAPQWLLPTPLSSIKGFYKGGEPVPLNAWKMPIIYWSIFFFALLFCMLCINTIVRKQWMDKERLTFPIVILPMEMTDENSSFWTNKIMWAGFLIPVVLESVNSLSSLFPAIPYVQIRANDMSRYFTVKPWNAMGYFPTTFYPLAIGLGFILATDISFSCWFFYVLTKLENVFASATGWTAGAGGSLSNPPYLGQQGTGAFIGIGLVIVWIARRHLFDVFRKAFSKAPDVDDSSEPMGYKSAVWGLIIGFLVMVGFCWKAGMSPLVAVGMLALYLIFSTTITRMRAEAGPAWTMGPDWNAVQTLTAPIGTASFGARSLVAMAFFNWFSIEMRCDPMPGQLESMKMAQNARIKQRAVMILMIAAIVAGIAAGFWFCLNVWYTYGAETAKVEPWRTGMGKAPFINALNAIQNPSKPDYAGTAAMTFGAAFTILLSYIRQKCLWFPFHPAGYVLANTGTMYWLWCPFLIAWMCKVTIIKYGGMRMYRKALPFFLGMVLGDYVISSLWAMAAFLLDIRIYRCFPC